MDKIKVKYNNTTFLPNSLIQEAIDEKWERSLAYFILLKQVYKKPIFYNYSLRKLSRKTGISVSVLCHHLRILKTKGLVSVSNNHLCVMGLNKLKKAYGVKNKLVPIQLDSNISNLILNIQFTRILPNFNNQQRIIEQKTSVIKFRNSSSFISAYEAKKLLKLEQRIFNQISELSVNDYLMLSNNSFGRLVNRSKYTGKNIQKRLNRANLIKSEKNAKLYSNTPCNRRAFYEQCLPSKYLHSKGKGYIWLSMPNKITVLTK